MRKIKEVLRLRFELGLGQRAIARACSISQSTVHEYLKRSEVAKSCIRMLAIPETTVQKMIREMIMVIRRMKPSPSGFMAMAYSRSHLSGSRMASTRSFMNAAARAPSTTR
jgi:transposase-like protein